MNPIQPLTVLSGLDGCRSCGSGGGKKKERKGGGVEVTSEGCANQKCWQVHRVGKRSALNFVGLLNDQLCTCETKQWGC